MATNTTFISLPPLPSYTLEPQPSLLPFLSDVSLTIAAPLVSYWTVSIIFHVIDEYDLFPQYRLHTPAELLKRNHATKWEVFRDVVLQQFIQTLFIIGVSYWEPVPMTGKNDYDVAVWAQRLRIAQQMLPTLLAVFGVNAPALGLKIAGRSSTLSSILAGGRYPQYDTSVVVDGVEVLQAGFAPWEMMVAKAIFWAVVPALQFITAIIILDTWQYFMHRYMHVNHFLYTAFHSRHHRLYVPYAYGALYNHPVESFFMDTLGAGVAYLTVGMTPRQQSLFFAFSSAKTVDDHCGYALPWDPLQNITSNNAAYHDIHHQSWGIKSNFSQPFFTFWDRFLNTMWKGDVKLRYEKTRVAADLWWEEQKQIALAAEAKSTDTPSMPLDAPSLPPTDRDATSGAQNPRRSPRKAAGGKEASLKGLKDRVSGSLPNGVPRVESRR